MIELKACIVCGHEGIEELYPATFAGNWEDAVRYFLTHREGVVHGAIRRCSSCGFVFTSPQFSKDEYLRIYQRVPTHVPDRAAARGQNARFCHLRKRILRYGPRGCFVDLGCGDGGFLRMMEGFEGLGVETRKPDGERIGGELSERILYGDLLPVVNELESSHRRRFDFLTAWDVLEHLPDLGEHMRSFHAVLKTGGYLFCTLPNHASVAARLFGSKWNCVLLEHLWYFTPATFRRYLRTFGFEAIEIGAAWYPVDMGTAWTRLGQSLGKSEWALPAPLRNVILPLPIGLMFAAARKVA
jgi:SAM-dependent methyltransferase